MLQFALLIINGITEKIKLNSSIAPKEINSIHIKLAIFCIISATMK